MSRNVAVGMTAAVVLSIAYLGLVKLTPYYMTNDDVALRAILEGALPGVPDAFRHLTMFINVLVGKLLVRLYDGYPGITWYDYFSLTLNLIGISAISYCLFEIVERWYAVAAVFVLMLTWGIVFFVSPQFSMTASLMGIAGTTLAVSTLVDENNGTWRLLPAFVLVSMGCLVRESAALLTVFAGSLYALPWLTRSSRRRVFPIVAVMAGILVFAFAAKHYDRGEYASTAGFENIRAFNLNRARLQEFSLHPPFNSASNLRRIDEALETAPLDETRINLLRSWVIADASVNEANLRAMMQAVEPYLSKTRNLAASLSEYAGVVFYLVEESFRYLLLLILACVVWPHRRSLVMTVWTLAVFGTLFALVFLFYKMPPFRVYYPLLFLAGIFVIFEGAQNVRGSVQTESRGHAVSIVLLVAAIGAAHLGVVRERSLHYWPSFQSVKSEVQGLDPAYRYIMFGSVLPVTTLVFPYKQAAALDDGGEDQEFARA